MNRAHSGGRRWLKAAVPLTALVALAIMMTASTTQAGPKAAAQAGPVFGKAAAFDVSPALSSMVSGQGSAGKSLPPQSGFDADRDLSPVVDSAALRASGSHPAAAASSASVTAAQVASAIPGTNANFEGLSNTDNFNTFGFRVNPPDPNRRRGAEPLRRDDQPRLRRVLEDGHAAARAGRHRHALVRLRDQRLHGSFGRPDRAARPDRRPLDPQSVHDGRSDVLQLRRDLDDPGSHGLVLPLRVLDRPQLPGLPEVRGLR